MQKNQLVAVDISIFLRTRRFQIPCSQNYSLLSELTGFIKAALMAW